MTVVAIARPTLLPKRPDVTMSKRNGYATQRGNARREGNAQNSLYAFAIRVDRAVRTWIANAVIIPLTLL